MVYPLPKRDLKRLSSKLYAATPPYGIEDYYARQFELGQSLSRPLIDQKKVESRKSIIQGIKYLQDLPHKQIVQSLPNESGHAEHPIIKTMKKWKNRIVKKIKEVLVKVVTLVARL